MLKNMFNGFVVSIVIFFAPIVHASKDSGEKGNGGGAVVCRDAQNKITSSELLDLWEGKNSPYRASSRLTILDDPALAPGQLNQPSQHSQIDRALKKLARLAGQRYSDRVRESIAIARRNVTLVPADVGIMPPPDAKNSFIKKGCRPEGVALYDDRTETLFLDQEIFDAMSPTSQAALWVHEGLYRLLRRDAKVTDSIRARILTAYLFSSDEFAHPRDGIHPLALRCEAEDHSALFYVQPDRTVQFLRIGFQPMITKTLGTKPISAYQMSLARYAGYWLSYRFVGEDHVRGNPPSSRADNHFYETVSSIEPIQSVWLYSAAECDEEFYCVDYLTISTGLERPTQLDSQFVYKPGSGFFGKDHVSYPHAGEKIYPKIQCIDPAQPKNGRTGD